MREEEKKKERRGNTHSSSQFQDFFGPYLAIPNLGNEGITTGERRARQSP